tara:strand:- start:129 stop:323 length:195 start_codon:yes stop_codon:yes gene_type:complete
MPKMKTHKAISSRFKVTKNGKILKCTDGKGHFNGKETGKVRRNKRRDEKMSHTLKKTIVRAISK